MLPLSNCKCSKFASEYGEIANKDHRKKHDQGPGAVLSIIHQKVFQLETLLFCLVVHLRSSLKHSARINRQTATGGGRDAERCNSKSARMRKGLHWGFRWSLWALGQVILKTQTLSYLEKFSFLSGTSLSRDISLYKFSTDVLHPVNQILTLLPSPT